MLLKLYAWRVGKLAVMNPMHAPHVNIRRLPDSDIITHVAMMSQNGGKGVYIARHAHLNSLPS